MSALWLARDGTIWTGFAGGVRHIRGDRIRPDDQPQGTLGSVTDLVEDHTGTVWAVSDAALFRVRDGRWESVPLVSGTPLATPKPVFRKLEPSVIDEELARLAG